MTINPETYPCGVLSHVIRPTSKHILIRRVVKISEVFRRNLRFFISRLQPPSLIRGYTKGTGGDERIICVRKLLFPVTKHNKELVEAQPWTNRSITHPPSFTAHMHTQVEGGLNREICTPPLKKILHVAIKSANSTFSCVRWRDVACRWFEIWQCFIQGFYHIKTTACVWMYTCYIRLNVYMLH